MALANAKFDQFIADVVNILREQADGHKELILNGVEDMEAYKLNLGMLGAYQAAETVIIDQARNLLGLNKEE
jgi:hypothetical protein